MELFQIIVTPTTQTFISGAFSNPSLSILSMANGIKDHIDFFLSKEVKDALSKKKEVKENETEKGGVVAIDYFETVVDYARRMIDLNRPS